MWLFIPVLLDQWSWSAQEYAVFFRWNIFAWTLGRRASLLLWLVGGMQTVAGQAAASRCSIYTRKSYVCWNEECVSSRQHVAYVLTILGVVLLRGFVNLKNLLEIRRSFFRRTRGYKNVRDVWCRLFLRAISRVRKCPHLVESPVGLRLFSIWSP